MEKRLIPIGDLQEANGGLAVRQVIDAAEDKELAANMEIFGQIYPLLVKETAKGFVVVDGNKRLRALRLMKDPPAEVECLLNPEAEIGHGLSANVMRYAMNPMDKCDAFSKVVARGNSPADVARAFGIKTIEVTQALALANLSLSIKDRVRAGTVSEDAAEALTLVNDTKLQEKLLKTCGNDGFRIKEAIRNSKPMIRHALFEKQAYEVAGGAYIVDLFGVREDMDPVCADADIFWKLQEAEITERLAALQKDGWKKIVKFEGTLPHAAYNWAPTREVKKTDRATHTLRYSVHATGEFKIADYAEPDKVAKKGKKAKEVAKPAATPPAQPSRPESYAGDGVRAFPTALTAELAYHRGCQVKEAIAWNKDNLGLRTLAYMLIVKEVGAQTSIKGPGSISWADSPVDAGEIADMPALDNALSAFNKVAKLRQQNGGTKLWARLAAATRDELIEILTCVAAGVFDGKTLGSWDLGQRILAERPIDGRKTFEPNSDFWARTSKGYMIAQLSAVAGRSLNATMRADLAAMKADELAEMLGRWFTNPEKIGANQLGLAGNAVPAEILKRFKAWVPHALELPSEAAARKAQTAAGEAA